MNKGEPGVSYGNAFFDSETGNTIAEGILTTAFIISLEVAVTKVFIRSRQRSVGMMMRREIYQRLSSWRELKDMLSGFDDHKEKIDDKKPKVFLKRLLVPIMCRILLFVAGATVIGMSGQKMEPHGTNTMQDYVLERGEPEDPIEISDGENFCREHLKEEDEPRHTAIVGNLQTCVKRQNDFQRVKIEKEDRPLFEISSFMKCSSNEYWFEIISPKDKAAVEYYSSEIIYGIATFKKVFVEVTYSSYDGYTQTLLPFADRTNEVLDEGSSSPTCDTIRQNWDEKTMDYIYEELKRELNLSSAMDQSFGKIDNSNLGFYYTESAAKFKYDGNEDDVVNALTDVLLNQFKLKELGNTKLYSFDPRTGSYGTEKGKGPRVYQKNKVAQWIWVVGIFGLSLISYLFSRTNIEDPEFYLYRAFLEANSMDPKLGPLAQPLDKNNDIFYFGSFKREGGLFSRFRRVMNKYSPLNRIDCETIATSPSSSISPSSSKENDNNRKSGGILAILAPSTSSEDSSKKKKQKEAKDKKQKKESKEKNVDQMHGISHFLFDTVMMKEEEEEVIEPLNFCGVDLGCFKV